MLRPRLTSKTHEWQQWILAVAKATRRQAITLGAARDSNNGPTVTRLIHSHCLRRLPDGIGSGPALLQT